MTNYLSLFLCPDQARRGPREQRGTAVSVLVYPSAVRFLHRRPAFDSCIPHIPVATVLPILNIATEMCDQFTFYIPYCGLQGVQF